MRRPASRSTRSLTLALALAACPAASMARAIEPDSDFTGFSLAELSELRISSVSKKSEPLAGSAASVYVITANDIRRTGATTLPEALRLAPNLQVARVDTHSWAISARGFNTTTANKLLVLIDGRPVYTPLFSGVFWDAQDLYMPDVERIEVISGPNATTWGSNAVNGVINVVTRSARQTGGTQLAVLAGDQQQRVQGRFGNSPEEGTAFRVYGKYFTEDDTEDSQGNERRDALHRAQAGFRAELDQDGDALSLQGDVYSGGYEQPLADDVEFSGVNLLAHWDRALASGNKIGVSGYYDRTERLLPETFEEHLDTVGVEARHEVNSFENHALLWGGDVRHARDHTRNFAVLAFLPEERNLTWTAAFVQDEIRFGEQTSLTLGARAEHNDYTGLEIMPNARIAWRPLDNHTLWGSLSRAVRTPSRIDTEFFIPAQPPYQIATTREFDSEIANVVELGYRGSTSPAFQYSLTAFHHDYDRLRSLEIEPSGTLVLGNLLRGTETGMEGWLTYTPLEIWRLSGGFLYLDKDLELHPSSTAAVANEGNDPDVQWQLRSSHNILANHELDIVVRYVDDLPDPQVAAYTAADVTWSWRSTHGFAVSLRVENMLDEQHVEFGQPLNRSEFGRTAYLELSWELL